MTATRVYLGLTENSSPRQTRIFAGVEGKLIDLSLAHARYLTQTGAGAVYQRAVFHFPETIANFLARGDASRRALEEVAAFARQTGLDKLRGPAGEKVVYNPAEIRLLPPFTDPEKSFVIGFSDRPRTEAMPHAEIPTGYYKLPQTFVTDGAPIVRPKFSAELDADACVALVIGKAGRRIDPARAWDYIAGVTLLIDITARDINRREGLTNNNLLGKNFPSSTCLGPAVWVNPSREEVETLEVELAVDDEVKQRFMLRQCVFTVEQIVARWSILGIKPGDFLAIGASMALQGDRLQNPAPLKIGSTVRCSSPALGGLSHRVTSAAGAPR